MILASASSAGLLCALGAALAYGVAAVAAPRIGDGARRVGLVVDEIIDIVQDVFDIRGRATRAGVAGTLVIQNRVTELFDVHGFLQRLTPLLASTEEV